MRCRHCGVEIDRRPHLDRWVVDYSKLNECRSQITEAWGDVGGRWLTCVPNNSHTPVCYHEPLIDIEEILASLRLIELDLR